MVTLPQSLVQELTDWYEESGIKGLTFQALRRTFATHFHRIGTVKDQQSQMRHADAQTTMNIYTQSVSDSLKNAIEFDRKMSGNVLTTMNHSWNRGELEVIEKMVRPGRFERPTFCSGG